MNHCPFCRRQAEAIDDLVSRVNRLVHERNMAEIRCADYRHTIEALEEALHLTRQSLIRATRERKGGETC